MPGTDGGEGGRPRAYGRAAGEGVKPALAIAAAIRSGDSALSTFTCLAARSISQRPSGSADLTASVMVAHADRPKPDPRKTIFFGGHAIPSKWDMETDVVVVGTGSGLAAAIEAAEAGAKVQVVEDDGLLPLFLDHDVGWLRAYDALEVGFLASEY